SMMLSAKGGISASQLARDLGITLKSAWFCTMKVRCAMIETITNLHGVVEADESYLGGKPRKKSNYNLATLSASKMATQRPQRGRGTDKVKVAGMIERDGRVAVKILDKLTSQNLLAMLHNNVSEEDAVLMTDDFRSYNSFDEYVERFVISHSSEGFAKGKIHINTIEGFWSILKNGIKGNYKALSKKYLPFYLAEFSYKYNRRNLPSLKFESFMKDALSEHKCMVCMHPEKDPSKIAYNVEKEPKYNIKKFNTANSLAGKKRRKFTDKNGII
ncbi:MAG: IS1595 family transposase, partial [Nanoarchaeota archaeon]